MWRLGKRIFVDWFPDGRREVIFADQEKLRMCNGFAMVSLERFFLTGLKNVFERIKEFCLERYRKTTCLVLAVLEI